ncbi:LysE/ArgO family amino acid transporter [Paraburkholderia sp.]|uniref:LysE/ArgO family amino acid transporter n=1 Tax=Paraburkholderia sp. TaxID=1926495 RepID=UPI003D6F2F0A
MLDASTFIEGRLLGAGLFTSVGPKDAFVIKRSLTSHHLFPIAIVCAGSDALLIALGAGGFAAFLARMPTLSAIAMWAGIAYLAGYGLLALRAAVRGTQHADIARTATNHSLAHTLLATAAVSLLNPYAWIDTVLVVGSLTANRAAGLRWPFALGAITASLAWFLCLTYGSRACRALFARASAWRALDAFVAIMMLGVATHLVAENL